MVWDHFAIIWCVQCTLYTIQHYDYLRSIESNSKSSKQIIVDIRKNCSNTFEMSSTIIICDLKMTRQFIQNYSVSRLRRIWLQRTWFEWIRLWRTRFEWIKLWRTRFQWIRLWRCQFQWTGLWRWIRQLPWMISIAFFIDCSRSSGSLSYQISKIFIFLFKFGSLLTFDVYYSLIVCTMNLYENMYHTLKCKFT